MSASGAGCRTALRLLDQRRCLGQGLLDELAQAAGSLQHVMLSWALSCSSAVQIDVCYMHNPHRKGGPRNAPRTSFWQHGPSLPMSQRSVSHRLQKLTEKA